MDVVIYHNPRCGTSRLALALIREAGIEPRVAAYLTAPPDREELGDLAVRAEGGARELLRAKEPLAAELGLTSGGVSDEVILDAIAAHPILLNRPVVATATRVKACRPAETVLAVLG